MRFKKMLNGLIGAMQTYCAEHDQTGEYTQDDAERVVGAGWFALTELPDAEMKEYAVYRYHFFTNDGKAEEIFPEYLKENGVLFERAIHLATFPLDAYTVEGDVREINSALDLVYDPVQERIHLLYRLMITDSEMTTIYRVETEEPEDFSPYEFVICLVGQLYGKLKHAPDVQEQVFFHEKEAA